MNPWQKVKIIKNEQTASDMKSMVVRFEEPVTFKAGQHFEICLPGENVIRKYSVVSSINEKENLEFGVQLIENGALSPKLWELKEGDKVEIRGPIGQSFVWDTLNPAPVVLVGAGSGITPLLSIYDSYISKYNSEKVLFIMSAKDESSIMHYDKTKDVLVTRFTRREKRIDLDFLKNKLEDFVKKENLNKNDVNFFICGSGDFTYDMIKYAIDVGFKKENIKSDRFI